MTQLRRYLGPLILGVGGCAVLVSLGVWQVQRLNWKTGVLAEIDSRIVAAPVALPISHDQQADRYLPVRVSGATTGQALHVLTSIPNVGPGYRVISAFRTDAGRDIMVDEGFVLQAEKDAERPATPMTVTGNLHWPDEADGFTPDPDVAANIWFAREVPQMAEALNTEPVLIVARTITGTDPRATPQPVTSAGVPNNHLGYAVQWFGLALVWAGMTAFLLWRIRRQTN